MKALRKTKFFFFFLILISVNLLLAQKVHIKNYTTDDGLPSAQVWCSLQDSKGYIWFGTSNGLVKYNGQEFINYKVSDGLVSSVVLALVEDNGDIWIVTDNGISRFNGESFINYVLFENLNFGIVWCAAKFQDCIWFGTKRRGLFKFDPKKTAEKNKGFINYSEKEGLFLTSIFSFAADKKYLWIANARAGLFRCDGKDFIDYTKKFKLENKTLTNLLIIGSTLFVGTAANGLFKYNLKNLQSIAGKSENGINYFPNDYIYSSVAKEDSLVFGTRGNGFIYYKNKPIRYTTANGLINNLVYSILIDKENSIWLCTNKGITKILSHKFLGYLENKSVLSVCEYKGAFWLGTFENGLIRLEGNSITVYTTDNGLLSNNQVFSLAVFDNKLWIGSFGGLNSYDGKDFKQYSEKDGFNKIPVLTLLPVGNSLWIGTVNRVWKYQPHKSANLFTLYTPEDGLTNTYFQSVCQDNNIIWFGTPGGAFCYDPIRSGQKFTKLSTDDGLSANCINAIFKDRIGTLWFGTPNGLNKYEPDKSGVEKKFTVFTTESGLSDNNIVSITQAGKYLWLGTSNGLNKFDGEKVIKVYNKKSGLIGNEATTSNSLYCDSKKHIWFCTYNGVTEYIPENDIPNKVFPSVYIEKFFVNNLLITDQKSLEFEYSRNTAKFYYIGLSFKDEDDVRYQFKLEGYDKDWSEITEKREIRYTNLNNGKYTFKVKARNGDGYWSEAPAELSFVILSPFWETWWFYLLCAAGVALLGMGVHWLRVRQLKKHKKELEEQVASRTIELEAANTELKDFAHIVSHDLKAPLRAVSQLASWISKDYSNTFDEDGQEKMNLLISRVMRMDNLIGGILQYSRTGRLKGKEEEVNLNSVVTEVIDNLAPPDNIKVTIENKLPVVWTDRVRIEQVFQNLISNALKFMDKPEGEIKIGCIDEGTHWKLSVADNGPGIEEKHYNKIFQIFQTLESRDKGESTGVGLSVVKKIIELYGGKIWVESKVGEGTTFFLTLPKKEEKDEV